MATRRGSCLAEFSIPRINRLLRPLRNKCAILASCTTSTSSAGGGAPATHTYGSSSCAPPSLDILRDPKLVISHVHLESRSLDALARQIYAVTNAYRNVVQATALASDGLDGSSRGVLSLADMCAATVGRNLQAQVARGLAALDGEIDEVVEMALSGEVYESVPMHYRRYGASYRLTYGFKSFLSYLPGGPSSHMRHLLSSTLAPIIRCSCLVSSAWRYPMIF